MNPINLSVRFLLEVAALIGIAVWSAQQIEGALSLPLSVVVVVIVAVVWGIFNVPGDPSRSGKAPVVVPGVVRLGIELSVFLLGGAGLYFAGYENTAYIMLVATAVHYLISYKRIMWLFSR